MSPHERMREPAQGFGALDQQAHLLASQQQPTLARDRRDTLEHSSHGQTPHQRLFTVRKRLARAVIRRPPRRHRHQRAADWKQNRAIASPHQPIHHHLRDHGQNR